ncbi:hypothetical protein [Anaerococcus sp. Marseille-Q5996]|uniref:hypothetical protein n=1 Tax=Anaerococcus sp. Marseille-Q5996 TaxID=2972769 RepID=UPI0021C85FDD|nr:hypothetical protein [Anaerococcus sp. Marseille-Q5996]
MNKFIKYDLKANRGFLGKLIILQIILTGLSFLGHGFLSANYLTDPVFSNGIFALATVFFIGINIFYMVLTINKDFNTERAILKYSLPKAQIKIIWAKVFELAIIYIINLIFLFIFLWALRFRITSDIVYFFALGLIWILILTSFVFYFKSLNRFGQGKRSRFYGYGLILLIIVLGFVVCKYFSFAIVNGAIQHTRPINYGFIFPFAVGSLNIYKNITPIVYYFLALIFVIFVNQLNIKNNLDLS